MMWVKWVFIHADCNRLDDLVRGLQNNYLMEQNNYPKTLLDAYSRLVYWKMPAGNNCIGNSGAGAFFNTIGEKRNQSQKHTSLVTIAQKKVFYRMNAQTQNK